MEDVQNKMLLTEQSGADVVVGNDVSVQPDGELRPVLLSQNSQGGVGELPQLDQLGVVLQVLQLQLFHTLGSKLQSSHVHITAH